MSIEQQTGDDSRKNIFAVTEYAGPEAPDASEFPDDPDDPDDPDEAVLPLITVRDYYDLLMEQQEQM